jgi:tRNA(adenine34) deaminase
MWNNLSLPWQACLEETWAAGCAGTIPIGAVVADAEGNILSRGRNRIFDTSAPAGQVCSTELAHAELNALLALGVDQGDRKTWALYTSTEPCPLCLGAFYMSGIRTLHYASRDPWAGSVNLLNASPYLSRKPIRAIGPERTDLEGAIVALFVAWELLQYGDRSSVVRDSLQETAPKGVSLGLKLHETDQLRQWLEARIPANRAFDRLLNLLYQ